MHGNCDQRAKKYRKAFCGIEKHYWVIQWLKYVQIKIVVIKKIMMLMDYQPEPINLFLQCNPN